MSHMYCILVQTAPHTRGESKLILMAKKKKFSTSLLPVRGSNIVGLTKLAVTMSPAHEKVVPVRTILSFR